MFRRHDHKHDDDEDDVGPPLGVRLQLTLVKANQLPVLECQTSNPYLKFQCNGVTHRSSQKKDEANPTWGETFEFPFTSYKMLLAGTLQIELLDQHSENDSVMAEKCTIEVW